MKKMNFKRGFTLIELLVVVAIIGILSSVVLASLNSARIKGADAAIKANLANMRGQAAIYYDGTGNGDYGANQDCTMNGATPTAESGCTLYLFGDSTFHSGLVAAARAGGATSANPVHCTTDVNGDAWACHAPVKTTGDLTFCVDSAGAAKKTSYATTTAGVCTP